MVYSERLRFRLTEPFERPTKLDIKMERGVFLKGTFKSIANITTKFDLETLDELLTSFVLFLLL